MIKFDYAFIKFSKRFSASHCMSLSDYPQSPPVPAVNDILDDKNPLADNSVFFLCVVMVTCYLVTVVKLLNQRWWIPVFRRNRNMTGDMYTCVTVTGNFTRAYA